MSEKFRVKFNVITSVVSFGINIALTFVTYRLVVWVGGLKALGLWSSLMAWIFIVRLGDVGMTTASVRFIAKCNPVDQIDKIRTYYDTALIMNIVIFSLLSILGYYFFCINISRIIVSGYKDQVAALDIMPLLFMGFFVSNLSGLVLSGLTGLHRGYLSALLGILGSLTQLSVVLWALPKFGLAGLALALIAQHALVIISGWALFLATTGQKNISLSTILPTHFSMSALREMLSFSLKSQAANLINGLFEPLSKIIIGRAAGLEILGLYELAYKTASLSRNVIVSGVQAIVPTLTRLLSENVEAARALVVASERRLTKTLALSSLVVVASLPVISWLILSRIDNRYLIFSVIMIVGFLGNSMGAAGYVLCVSAGRAELLLRTSGINIFTVALLTSILTPFFGYNGGVLAVGISLAIGGAYVKYLSQRIWE